MSADESDGHDIPGTPQRQSVVSSVAASFQTTRGSPLAAAADSKAAKSFGVRDIGQVPLMAILCRLVLLNDPWRDSSLAVEKCSARVRVEKCSVRVRVERRQVRLKVPSSSSLPNGAAESISHVHNRFSGVDAHIALPKPCSIPPFKRFAFRFRFL
jgi:hypothetical protein